MACKTVCESPKLLISSDQAHISEYCRSLEYYVDPFSEEILELGTYEYPYRTMSAIISELVNFHSNSNRNISIFIKDVYVEDQTMHIINITSVRI